MIKLKDLLTEAPQIKKVKNVSVQYFGAEYAGEMSFSGYFRKAWLYEKDNGEWFAVIITKNKNRYEIQLGKHKDKLSADKAAEKIIKRNLRKLESIKEGMNKRQAGEMLKQLGGNRFIMMTGAKNFGVGPKGAGFKIGRNSKGVNFVRIDLKNDLYNMEFIQLRKKRGSMDVNMKVLKRVKGVYADQLQSIFTKHTGMYTSL
tara:strand:+ start:316 stop:921 length:606 start_codon:yes stop_codon:yes gene_type:complete